MNEKDIYKMKLFESIQLSPKEITTWEVEIIRVPGGWIYSKGTMQGDALCFIPFDNEFMS